MFGGMHTTVICTTEVCTCRVIYFIYTYTQAVQVGAPYFVAEFDDGPNLFVKIKGRFSLQFGRYSVTCMKMDCDVLGCLLL